MKRLLILLISTIPIQVFAEVDFLKTKRLEEVVIKGKSLHDLERLQSVEGTTIWSGKKNEVISVQNLNANIAEKTLR